MAVGKIVTTTLEASTVPVMRDINLDKMDFPASVRNKVQCGCSITYGHEGKIKLNF